jgi:hypothetical protein
MRNNVLPPRIGFTSSFEMSEFLNAVYITRQGEAIRFRAGLQSALKLRHDPSPGDGAMTGRRLKAMALQTPPRPDLTG